MYRCMLSSFLKIASTRKHLPSMRFICKVKMPQLTLTSKRTMTPSALAPFPTSILSRLTTLMSCTSFRLMQRIAAILQSASNVVTPTRDTECRSPKLTLSLPTAVFKQAYSARRRGSTITTMLAARRSRMTASMWPMHRQRVALAMTALLPMASLTCVSRFGSSKGTYSSSQPATNFLPPSTPDPITLLSWLRQTFRRRSTACKKCT
mmetsp:Transcript_8121/g.25048  ORF Transcript_8121/g.25048 Transcript_8121/m.25048 type:complete len:207 (-) Transcript_8121:343-963(-)